MRRLAILAIVFAILGVMIGIDILYNTQLTKQETNKMFPTDPTILNNLYGTGSPADAFTLNASNTAAGIPLTNQTPTAPTPAPVVDPYAAYGGQAKYNSLVDGYNTQQQNIQGGAQDQANAYGSTYHNNILDFLDNQRLGQQGIDTQNAKNELAKTQGVSGILGMVGQGIQSSGVQLANRNAGDSSAAQALANAYGTLGRNQMSSVGNQYALGQNDIQRAQDTYNTQQQMGVRDLQSNKMDNINNIVNNARTQLAYLDAQMVQANLPNRMALDQLKQDIQDKAVSALQGYDQELTNGVGGIHAQTPDQVKAQAAQMANAGNDLGANAFHYTTQAPIQFQNSGPSPSSLPLFSLNKSKQTA